MPSLNNFLAPSLTSLNSRGRHKEKERSYERHRNRERSRDRSRDRENKKDLDQCEPRDEAGVHKKENMRFDIFSRFFTGYAGPSKEMMKKINQLFHPECYRAEEEYIITNPLKLEWHFSESWIITAAIKYQYRIIWDTRDGMTETMSLWQLPIKVTPNLRKEFVQVDLFRHMKFLAPDVCSYDICPPIYARLKRPGSSTVSWQKTVYDPDKEDFYTTSAPFPEWIKDDDLEVKLVRKYRNKKVGLESFFFKAALDTFELGRHLHAKNIVYYFVIHDQEVANFQELYRPIEGLHTTQVYVGSAKEGILDRWVKRSSSHCSVSERLCHHLKRLHSTHEKYVPNIHQSAPSLLESYLALCKVKRYQCAVFVLYDLDTEKQMQDMENDLVVHHNLTNMHRGLNEKLPSER